MEPDSIWGEDPMAAVASSQYFNSMRRPDGGLHLNPTNTMNILVILLILLLLGGGGYGFRSGNHMLGGIASLIVVILIVLLVMGRI